MGECKSDSTVNILFIHKKHRPESEDTSFVYFWKTQVHKKAETPAARL